MATANCQEKDTTDVLDYDKDVPGWLKDKIINMSLDERYYTGAKVYRYDMGGEYLYHIYRPFDSCVYCELYDEDGTRLKPDEVKYFSKNKGEALLIWENRPPVPFDSLKWKQHDGP